MTADFVSLILYFFYTQPDFVHLLLDFCIIRDHIVAFFLFVLFRKN